MSVSSFIRPLLLSDRAAEPAVIDRAFAAGPYGHLAPSDARSSFQHDTEGRLTSGEVLVAADATGDVIGSASVLRAGTLYSRVARDEEVEIRLLAVEPSSQGSGVAGALISAALETAVGWGAEALVLDTGSLNTRSQALYERVGFHRLPERDAEVSDGLITGLVYGYRLQQGDTVRVRLMRSDETSRIVALLDAAYSHDYDLPAGYRANVLAVADRASEHQVWVAEDRASGRLVGTVATPRAGSTISELARDGELDFRLLAVDPSERRSGLGELLTRHVLTLGRLRVVDRVVMNSGPEMFGAHRLYERMGFVRLRDREPIIDRGDGTTFRLLSFGYELA